MLSRPADGHAGVSRWTGLRPDSTIQVACDCFREKEEEEEEREEEEEGDGWMVIQLVGWVGGEK